MLAYQSTQQVSLLGGGVSIVIYIVIFVFVHIPSLTILYIVNVSTVSLFQRNIAYHALPVSGPLDGPLFVEALSSWFGDWQQMHKLPFKFSTVQ